MLRKYLLILPMLLLLCSCASAPAASPAPGTQAEPLPTDMLDEPPVPEEDGKEASSPEMMTEVRILPDTNALHDFTSYAVPRLLEGEGNRVCSPINIYLALGMLTEITDGESREQLLELLAQTDMEALRVNADELWTAHYRDDSEAASKLAASLWLRQDMDYRSEALQRLAEGYRAEAFRADMGTREADEALQSWVNEQTGGLLEQQAGGLKLGEETLMALVSTIYYKAPWTQPFDIRRTEPGIFHAAAADVDCQYMNRSSAMLYNRGSRFAAVTLGLKEGRMELILPDEGTTPAMLLDDEEFWAYARHQEVWEQSEYVMVDLAMPRFDVCSDLDLRESLQDLGVRDVFNARLADFSPLSSAASALSQVRHAVRVTADEEGVEAAAYTMMGVAMSARPPEESVAFRLERPFIFLLRGDDGAPLFLGVVETPA